MPISQLQSNIQSLERFINSPLGENEKSVSSRAGTLGNHVVLVVHSEECISAARSIINDAAGQSTIQKTGELFSKIDLAECKITKAKAFGVNPDYSLTKQQANILLSVAKAKSAELQGEPINVAKATGGNYKLSQSVLLRPRALNYKLSLSV